MAPDLRRASTAWRSTRAGSGTTPQITPETLLRMEAGLAESAAVIMPGLPLGVAGLRLHLGHDGDRRGTGVRAAARGPPRGPAHHPDHRGLRRLPRLRRQAPRRPHALPRRRERHRPPLHRGARLRGAGVRLLQRGGRPPGRPHLRRPRSATPRSSSGATRAWTPCSSPAPACAWPRWRARSRTAVGKPVTSSNHAMAWHALRLAGIADLLPQWGKLFAAGLPED